MAAHKFSAIKAIYHEILKRFHTLLEIGGKYLDISLIRQSDMFDNSWYIKTYPHFPVKKMDAAEHYLVYGGAMGFNPSPKFDAVAYLEANPDVANSGVNPLFHYENSGKSEGRPAIPVIDTSPIRNFIADKSPKLPLVLYESHDLNYHGAQNSLMELASGIKAGNSFETFMMSSNDGPLANQYKSNNIKHFMHGISLMRIIANMNKNVDTLSSIYSCLSPDIIHVNTIRNFFAVLAVDRAGIPAIWNIRESEDPESCFDFLPSSLRPVALSCFERARAIVFVSKATQALWNGHLPGRAEQFVIPNGLDTRRLGAAGMDRKAARRALGIREDQFLALNVGAACERKGQKDILDAMQLVQAPFETERFAVALVGLNQGAYADQLREDAEALRRSGMTILTIEETHREEERRKLGMLYAAADVFILSSRLESYPRVVLEAMHFGLPVISTPCIGVNEQLVDGEGVIYYDVGDSKGLLSRIRFLANHEEVWRTMSLANRTRLPKVSSYDQMVDSYSDLYRHILPNKN